MRSRTHGTATSGCPSTTALRTNATSSRKYRRTIPTDPMLKRSKLRAIAA